jgi:hypothetical protein
MLSARVSTAATGRRFRTYFAQTAKLQLPDGKIDKDPELLHGSYRWMICERTHWPLIGSNISPP